MSDESFTGFTSSDLKKLRDAVKKKPEKERVQVPKSSTKYAAKPSTLLDISSKKEKRRKTYIGGYENKGNITAAQQLSSNNGHRDVEKSSEEEEIESEGTESQSENVEDKTEEPYKQPTLEDFETRQKQIEEDNKKQRKLLTQAIRERTQKTEAEHSKLLKIQNDLNKLDDLLSTDVSILRDQIDTATAEFDEAQKRYEKAEKEFVNTKLNMFKKMERKEMLAEYLCTIIEQNEIRKSDKLAGLMDQLNMDVQSDSIINSAPVLPQLSSMNEMIYNNCITLKDPNLNKKSPKKDNDTSVDQDKVSTSDSDMIDTVSIELAVTSEKVLIDLDRKEQDVDTSKVSSM